MNHVLCLWLISFHSFCKQSRAKEVIKWRQDQEDEIKLKAIAIEQQKAEASTPRKHFASQEERRQVGYQAMIAAKGQPLARPKEVTGSDDPELNIVIKGELGENTCQKVN